MGNTVGKTVATIAGKKKFLNLRDRGLRFHVIHDDRICLSDDKQTARWGCSNTNTDGEGRCYSHRTLRENEEVRISVRGSGFFDLELTDVHPAELHNNKDFLFKYVVSKVLYFEPVEMRLRIDSDGSVYFTDGNDPEVKLVLGAQASSHWLAMKLGCGEVRVTFLSEDESADEESSSSPVATPSVHPTPSVIMNTRGCKCNP